MTEWNWELCLVTLGGGFYEYCAILLVAFNDVVSPKMSFIINSIISMSLPVVLSRSVKWRPRASYYWEFVIDLNKCYLFSSFSSLIFFLPPSSRSSLNYPKPQKKKIHDNLVLEHNFGPMADKNIVQKPENYYNYGR